MEYLFRPVENVLTLEPTLTKRLPASANIYNIMRLNQNCGNEQKWFTLQDPVEDDVWIIANFFRQDYGQIVAVSRPPNAQITPEVRSAFSNCEFLDWAESFMFACVDTTVSSMVSDISIREKGNCTEVHPCYLYIMEPKDALELKIPSGNYEVKPINNKEGLEFILKTWKYATEGSSDNVGKCLQRNVSAGVYVNNEIVAGVITDSHGLIGMLYSLNEVRGKGYGRLVMHQIIKESAANQLVPSCTVELRNGISMAFQEKIGLKIAADVDFVMYRKSGF
ncbi:unnamed protein product [Allacma fusca]|uniref:GCN5-related N-acetyltransferase Rv2170-like domain-containing protein n=1 Tax=Allacma fusca TaxID=39272 RepID=A0A8J2JU26_9HEXA|nr:unnamed protein product [Allacma fusca]